MTKSDAIVARLKAKATPWVRGNRFQDFSVGQKFVHHWGRTITESDNTTFSVLTLHYNPMYTNRQYALVHGHKSPPVNPLLVFNTVFGLSVEDLSEGGGPFLGVNDLEFVQPVYSGDTLYASSEVMAARRSEKRPDFGIVTWHTRGVNQHEEPVVSYQRSNLVRIRK